MGIDSEQTQDTVRAASQKEIEFSERASLQGDSVIHLHCSSEGFFVTSKSRLVLKLAAGRGLQSLCRAALRAHGSRPAARTLLEAVAARAEAAPSATPELVTASPGRNESRAVGTWYRCSDRLHF